MSPVEAGAIGALLTGSLVVFVAALMGYLPPRPRPATLEERSYEFEPKQAVAVIGAFVAAFVLVGHPVFAITAGLAVLIVWGRLGSKRETKEFLDRENAAVVWMESVAGSLRHSHINVAIASAGEYADPHIRPAAQRLTRNLQHIAFDDAMRRFADEMQSRSIDSVAAALTLTASEGGAEVGDLIREEARRARARAVAIGEVAQSQSGDRVVVRQVLGVTVVMAIGIPLISSTVMSWYDTANGYLAMILLSLGFLWCLRYMVELARNPEPPRFFGGTGDVVSGSITDGARR